MDKARAKVEEKTKAKPKGFQATLYKVIDHVDPKILKAKKKKKAFRYGWDPEHDFVCISKDGTVGEFYLIQGLVVGIPAVPKTVHKRHKDAEEQYWDISPSPDDKLLATPQTCLLYTSPSPRDS